MNNRGELPGNISDKPRFCFSLVQANIQYLSTAWGGYLDKKGGGRTLREGKWEGVATV